MKKRLLLISIILIYANIQAQDRKIWIDLQLAGHYGLNEWKGMEYIDQSPYYSTHSDYRFTLNLNAYKNAGLYGEFAYTVTRYPDNSVESRTPCPFFNLNNYYVNDAIEDVKSSLGIKLGLGAFYMIKHNKWDLIPSVGWGIKMMDDPSYSFIAKQKDSNVMYNVTYEWGLSKPKYMEQSEMNYLTARLNYTYRVGKHTSLMVGLEYMYYINRINLYATVNNYYAKEIVQSYYEKGNHLNSLGFNLGISFR